MFHLRWPQLGLNLLRLCINRRTPSSMPHPRVPTPPLTEGGRRHHPSLVCHRHCAKQACTLCDCFPQTALARPNQDRKSDETFREKPNQILHNLFSFVCRRLFPSTSQNALGCPPPWSFRTPCENTLNCREVTVLP